MLPEQPLVQEHSGIDLKCQTKVHTQFLQSFSVLLTWIWTETGGHRDVRSMVVKGRAQLVTAKAVSKLNSEWTAVAGRCGRRNAGSQRESWYELPNWPSCIMHAVTNRFSLSDWLHLRHICAFLYDAVHDQVHPTSVIWWPQWPNVEVEVYF